VCPDDANAATRPRSCSLPLWSSSAAAMKSAVAVALLAGSASAFVQRPALSNNAVAKAAQTSTRMAVGDGMATLVGSDLELPAFDPIGFSNNPNQDTINWYRAAELKHGRVAMVAALGEIVQSYWHLPDPVFSESAKPFDALLKVYSERPLAFGQVVLAIAACEAVGQAKQSEPGRAPGDLGWDPLSLRPQDPENWEKQQLRELKNGRLAMFGIAGMWLQESLTGQGPIEQIYAGHVNPFGDGQGFF